MDSESKDLNNFGQTLTNFSGQNHTSPGGRGRYPFYWGQNMKLNQKLIMDTVAELVGDDVLPVVNYLKDRRNISEFKIAEKVRLEVNETRNMLYRLHNHSLVSYHRKKDKEKGWYISYWTFNPKRINDLIVLMNRERLQKLYERLSREEENLNCFFICSNLCSRLDFEKALEFEFKCPECGSLMNQQDNTKTVEHLQRQITELKVVEAEFVAVETQKIERAKKRADDFENKRLKKAKPKCEIRKTPLTKKVDKEIPVKTVEKEVKRIVPVRNVRKAVPVKTKPKLAAKPRLTPKPRLAVKRKTQKPVSIKRKVSQIKEKTGLKNVTIGSRLKRIIGSIKLPLKSRQGNQHR